jgi:hypothetical protein
MRTSEMVLEDETVMDAAEFAGRLPNELSWNETNTSNAISERYCCYLHDLFGQALAVVRHEDREMAEAIELMVCSADANSLSEAILDPYVAFVLIHPERLYDQYWRCLAFVEFSRILNREIAGSSLKRIIVSARHYNSDHSFPINISIDDELPIPHMEGGGNAISLIPSEAHRILMSKTKSALDVIASNPIAFDFFSLGTERLSFRRESDVPTKFSSGSFRDLPGLSLMLNADQTSISALSLADAMVHESIHAVLYKYEALGPRLVPPGHSDLGRIASPWTGTPLEIDSFVQACFVWYGLHSFWIRAVAIPESHSFVERSEKGFKSLAYNERCNDCEQFLAPGVGQVLRSLPSLL